MEHGDVLMRFAEALVDGDPDAMAEARDAVTATMGAEAMVDAAGVASNFERMVRIADGCGIELGESLAEATAQVRAELGVERPEGR